MNQRWGGLGCCHFWFQLKSFTIIYFPWPFQGHRGGPSWHWARDWQVASSSQGWQWQTTIHTLCESVCWSLLVYYVYYEVCLGKNDKIFINYKDGDGDKWMLLRFEIFFAMLALMAPGSEMSVCQSVSPPFWSRLDTDGFTLTLV